MMMNTPILWLLLLLILFASIPCLEAFIGKSTRSSSSSSSRNGLLFAVQVQSQQQQQQQKPTTTVDASETTNQIDDDYKEQRVQLQKQISLSSASTSTPIAAAVPRALELFDIVWNGIVSPVYTTLLRKGLPDNDNWNDFWLNQVNSTSVVEGSSDDTMTTTLATQVTLALEKMGPTYVKFGQALASRPDIVPRSLAQALSQLQDSMQPFDTGLAKDIIQHDLKSKFNSNQDLQAFVSSLSEIPVAAASIGQVYSGRLPNTGQKVAIKVQRPGINEIVKQDSSLLKTIVEFIESIPAISAIQKDQERLVETDLSGAVDEFMSRILEELDYRNEARNIQLFYDLYSHRRQKSLDDDDEDNRIEVVVPEVYMDLCTDRVLVMEWIDGTHLVDLESEATSQESFALIEQALQCTLSQLLDTGVLHADPHGGNLLKVMDNNATTTTAADDGSTEATPPQPIQRLGYVDFGLLSTVPVTVRDGLVCAVAELVFARNVSAVANLFGELQLIPEEVLSDPSERIALTVELNQALTNVLKYDNGPPSVGGDGTETQIPSLRFDKLLDVLSRLVPRFKFQLPPYFLNNARALGTLEGMAREIDPTFNVLQALYPYVLGRLLSNPTESSVVEGTLQSLIRNPVTGRIDSNRVQKLIDDSTTLTGYSKRKVLLDILKSKNGPRLAKIIIKEQLRQIVGKRFSKMANYLRL